MESYQAVIFGLLLTASIGSNAQDKLLETLHLKD